MSILGMVSFYYLAIGNWQAISAWLDHAMQSFGADGYGISITTDCEDPVRAIKFLDWLSSDEGQVLRNWGIERETLYD